MAEIEVSIIDKEGTATCDRKIQSVDSNVLDSNYIYVQVPGVERLLKLHVGRTAADVISIVAGEFGFTGGSLQDGDDEGLRLAGADAPLGSHLYTFKPFTSVQGHASEPVAELVKHVNFRLGCIEQAVLKKFEEQEEARQIVVKKLEAQEEARRIVVKKLEAQEEVSQIVVKKLEAQEEARQIVVKKLEAQEEFSQNVVKKLEAQEEVSQNVVRKLEELSIQVDSSSSCMPSMSDPDKGIRVSKSSVRLILPKPLSGEEAEGLWPEVCWKNLKGLTPEKHFKELLNALIDDGSSVWKIKFTGSSPSVCGPDLKPDVLIYKRPPSPGVGPVPLTTGVILELHSNSGKYNSNPNIGKAARYGEKMLENLMGFRRSVLVGVTDLERVQWFKVIMKDKKSFIYEVHSELNDVRGSLCALLKSSLSDLEVELPVLTVSGVEYEPIRFLGSGATSNVLCVRVKDDAREYAAKIPLHGKNLQNDYRMLTCLNDVEGVPKALGWFDGDKSLRIHPVGERVSHKSISSCWSLVPGLVDVLERAHELGVINRDVRPDNIMIAKGESEEIEMLYILDWGYAVAKKIHFPFSGGVMYASERILQQLADGDHQVVADERDDCEALVHTIFALRYRSKFRTLRGLNRQNFDGIRRFWSECYDEYPAWQSAWTAARSGEYVKLKMELQKMAVNFCLS